jgi:hypothetical protein
MIKDEESILGFSEEIKCVWAEIDHKGRDSNGSKQRVPQAILV